MNLELAASTVSRAFSTLSYVLRLFHGFALRKLASISFFHCEGDHDGCLDRDGCLSPACLDFIRVNSIGWLK